MSMTFYCYRPDHTRPVGDLATAEQIADDEVYIDAHGRLEPTPGQELAAGWFHGPNLSNANALMVLRSLNLDERICPDTGCVDALDPADLKGRILTALAVGGAIADDGQPDVDSAQYGLEGVRVIDCGVRPGYFADVYERLLPVCEQALAWDVDVVVA